MFIALSLKAFKTFLLIILIFAILGFCLSIIYKPSVPATAYSDQGFIKWVDFRIPSSIMERAMNYDIKSQQKDVKINWIELLAYLAAKMAANSTRILQNKWIILLNDWKTAKVLMI